MVRASRISLKNTNIQKLSMLKQLFNDYRIDLQYYLSLIISKEMPVGKFLSSKQLPTNKLKHSQWKQIIYKQASQIYRGNYQITKKKVYKQYKKIYAKAINRGRLTSFTNKRFKQLNIDIHKRMPNIEIKNIAISIDNRLLSSQFSSSYFNQFIGIKLPYFQENKKRAIQINLPIMYHKHYRKFKNWTRKNSIKLLQLNNKFFIQFTFQKQTKLSVQYTNIVGIDVGYKKTITTSNNQQYGSFVNITKKIKNKQQGSKNYKQSLIQRTNQMNACINQFFKENTFDTIVIENVKHIKTGKKTKYNGLTNWTCSAILHKLQSKSEQSGIKIVKVSPSYTSQMCSKCGVIDKENRKGQIYYCNTCGLLIDADYNASINILQRGVNLLSKKDNPSCTENKF